MHPPDPPYWYDDAGEEEELERQAEEHGEYEREEYPRQSVPRRPFPRQNPGPDPQVLRALRAELYRHRGGHMPEVQADVGKLGTQAARVILNIIRDLGAANSRMRGQPWRRF